MLLCSIINKILAHVIWKSFNFHFIKIKKNVPIFPEFGLYYKTVWARLYGTIWDFMDYKTVLDSFTVSGWNIIDAT